MPRILLLAHPALGSFLRHCGHYAISHVTQIWGAKFCWKIFAAAVLPSKFFTRLFVIWIEKSDSFSFFYDFCFTFLRTILRNWICIIKVTTKLANLFNEYLITFKILVHCWKYRINVDGFLLIYLIKKCLFIIDKSLKIY